MNKTDQQNWEGPQKISARRVQACLHDLQVRTDVLHERNLGTEVYLEIYRDYIDMLFFSKT